MQKRDRVRITKSVVEAAACPAGASELWVRDSELRGFSLRVRGGRKLYVLKYATGRRGKARKVTIGEHGAPWKGDAPPGQTPVLTADRARAEALRLLGLRAGGSDPAEARATRRAIPTLREFSKRYTEEYSTPHKAPSTVEGEGRLLKSSILPALGSFRLDELTAQRMTRFHLARKDTPTNANRALAIVSHMFTMARRWGVLPEGHPNPCSDVRRFPEKKRKRFLSLQELARVGEALALAEANDAKRDAWRPPADGAKGEPKPLLEVSADPVACDVLRVLIFTGARASEVLELKREQINWEAGLALQHGKTGERPIYFSAPAQQVIKNQPLLQDNPYVFVGRRHGTHLTLSGLEAAWERIRIMADVPDVRVHDLRHSFASMAVAGGATLPMIGALLGHSQPSTTQRYAHLSADPLWQVTQAVTEKIEKAWGKRAAG